MNELHEEGVDSEMTLPETLGKSWFHTFNMRMIIYSL